MSPQEKQGGFISGIHIGYLKGVNIELNWSVLVICGLLSFALATVQYPLSAPGRSGFTYWAFAIVTVLIFFACLLAHEMAHSIVARHAGIEVRRIVLWMFGGVSEMVNDSPNAKVEFRVGVVGPLASFAIAIGCTFLAIISFLLNWELIAISWNWLALINFILAVFNLIPAFPLDGGRVLRSILWQRYNDKLHATENAATAGRIFGYILIGLGFLLFLNGGLIGGPWLILIGLFLVFAAGAEEMGSKVDSQLTQMKVRDVMTADPITVPESVTIERLVDDWIRTSRVSSFPVVADNRDFSGLITISEVQQIPTDQRNSIIVRDAMMKEKNVITCAPDEEILTMLKQVGGLDNQRIVVLDDHDKVVGILSSFDVTRALQRASLNEK